MLADLHNHSCLSPCGSLEMSPRRIAATAAAKGIGMVALTDHNSARNCPAFGQACARYGVAPLFGMEITTAEECHVLALFDDLESALKMDRWVIDVLPRTPLNLDYYSDQAVVNGDDEIIELIDFYLGLAIPFSLEQTCEQTHRLGGLFIPSHINRHAFSIESQLGFLPDGDYDAIEVLHDAAATYRQRYPHLPVITASDAHTPEQIGTHPFHIPLQATDIASIRQALKQLVTTPHAP